MAVVLRCHDVFGRRAELTDRDWAEIARARPAVAGRRSDICPALSNPDQVTEDRAGARRQHFYRAIDLPGPLARGYLKVTVDLRRRGALWSIPVRIVDADIVNRWPREEKMIWPPTTPGRLPM